MCLDCSFGLFFYSFPSVSHQNQMRKIGNRVSFSNSVLLIPILIVLFDLFISSLQMSPTTYSVMACLYVILVKSDQSMTRSALEQPVHARFLNVGCSPKTSIWAFWFSLIENIKDNHNPLFDGPIMRKAFVYYFIAHLRTKNIRSHRIYASFVLTRAL